MMPILEISLNRNLLLIIILYLIADIKSIFVKGFSTFIRKSFSACDCLWSLGFDWLLPKENKLAGS